MQKKIYVLFLVFLISAFSFNLSFGQGIIVNEASQGTGGTKEFIELLVVGSNALTTASIDLTGWIVDDNNGDFELSGGGVGIAAGYLILGSCLNNVKPGDLIVIYNNGDKNLNMPADDFDDTNPQDGVYIFPHTAPCLSQCSSNPDAGIPTSSYIPCTAGVSNPVTAWRSSLRNGGDAAQTRQPDGTFFSGFSYGDVTAPFPNFPSGTSSFNIGAMGAGRFVGLGCGDGAWEASANYATGDAASDTPGAANNVANTILISEVQAGSFDYNNLNNPENCDGIILPVELISFIGNREGTNVILNWKTTWETDNDYFDIEMSFDGQRFAKVGSVVGQGTTNSLQKYDFLHQSESYQTEYYRLKQVDFDGAFSYSPVIAVSPMQNTDLSLETYPQPIQDILKLKIISNKSEYIDVSIYNTLGQVIYSQKIRFKKGNNDLSIKTEDWNLGAYFVQIKNQSKVITKRILKNL